MNVKLIPIHAPPAPKCFETRDVWVSYLVSAHQAAAGGTKRASSQGGRSSNAIKPFVDGKYNSAYPFCRDCPAQHAHAMTVAGRCDFAGWVASITPATTEQEASNAAAA